MGHLLIIQECTRRKSCKVHVFLLQPPPLPLRQVLDKKVQGGNALMVVSACTVAKLYPIFSIAL